MSRVESYAPGTPSWVDLASPDVERSIAFYGDLFGWDAPELPPEAGGYRMFESGGVPVAGCGPIMMQGQPPAWTTYVSVADADAAVARVTVAGGTVLAPPMDVLDAGRMAVFSDTTGAACAVWQPRRHPGAGLVNQSGALVWNELSTVTRRRPPPSTPPCSVGQPTRWTSTAWTTQSGSSTAPASPG